LSLDFNVCSLINYLDVLDYR